MRSTLPRVLLLLVSSSVALPAQTPALQSGAFAWRGIGPANMMGRIASVDAVAADHRRVLVGSASGGVFLSDNAGTTWRAIFDGVGPGSIGAARFSDADPEVIWVGTGEAANRNSVGWGDGVYVSTDGGRSFRHAGLEDTRQVAEFATHPTDPKICYAAAVGSVWGPSGSRGLYKTTDAGQSWTKLGGGLPTAPLSGCTEVVVDPKDPDRLLCAFYERLRTPWSMQSGGPNGGIFESTDAGATWRKVTAGLPTGDTGMIDLDVCLAQPDVWVAAVEASKDLPDTLEVPGPGVYRSDDGGRSWRFLLRHATRPFYHGQIAIDPTDPQRIYVVSRDFRVSTDGGKTFRNKWWGGGGDDHDLWVSPQDGRVRYMATDQGAYLTVDDGRTVVGFENMAIGQYYAIGVDMRDPYHVMGGLQDNAVWSGPSMTREPRGVLNMHNTWIVEGDGFHCQIDPTDWRTTYAVVHCGFCCRVDLLTRDIAYITPTPETISNFGDWFDPDFPEMPIRYTIDPGEYWMYGRSPGRPILPAQFRFNWSSPLVMSPHDPKVIYFGGNHLFESRDRGESWRIASPDLTTNAPQKRNPSEQGGLTRNVTGGENHCTIITIGVSPLDPEVLWCGTDDGCVQVTRDDGAQWTDVRPALDAAAGAEGVRPGAWISRVEPSNHVAGRCYVTLDDHRRDDFRPFVFRTDDFGASWTDVTGDLPEFGSVYVVCEDEGNEGLLYCGTEFGCFYTLDGGAHWRALGESIPQVAVHDLVIHPREVDLVAGTHGRSIWILDDLTGLRQLTAEVRAQPVALLEPRRATLWKEVRLGRKQPSFLFRGENPPRAANLHFWSDAARAVEIEVREPGGARRWTDRIDAVAGLNRVRWNLQFRTPEPELDAVAARLGAAIDVLLERVAEPPEDVELLRTMRDHQLRGARARGGRARQLEQLRADLVHRFGRFAAGEPLFGERVLSRVDASAGTYKVILRAGDDEFVTTLEVRADPLEDE